MTPVRADELRDGCLPILRFLGGALLLFVGLGAVLFAAMGLYYAEGDRGTLAVIMAAGVLLIGTVVALVVRLERRLRQEDEARAVVRGRSSPSRSVESPVLARWTYEPAEWAAFSARELRVRKRDVWIIAAGMLAFGVFFLSFFTDDWAIRIGGGAVLSALVTLLQLRGAHAQHAADRAVTRPEVIVRENEVEINGRRHLLEDDRWWLAGARFLADAESPVLEITSRTEKINRHGTTQVMDDVLRVPVPRGREDEARRIAERLRDRAIPDEDDGPERHLPPPRPPPRPR